MSEEIRVFLPVDRMLSPSGEFLDINGKLIERECGVLGILMVPPDCDGARFLHDYAWQEASAGRAMTTENLRRHGFQSRDDLNELLNITGWHLNITSRFTSAQVVFQKIDARRKVIRERYPKGAALFEVFKDWWDGKLRPDFFHVKRTGFYEDPTEEFDLHPEDYKDSFANWHVSAGGNFHLTSTSIKPTV